jgi:hypothetical protein
MDFISSKKDKKVIIAHSFIFRFHKMLVDDIQRWKYFLNVRVFLNYHPL